MPKFLTIHAVKTPDDREAYVVCAVRSWKNGHFRSLIKDFALVFPEKVMRLAAQRAGMDIEAPNRQPFLSFLKVISELHGGGGYGDRAIFLSKIAGRLVIEARADSEAKVEANAALIAASSVALSPYVLPTVRPKVTPKQNASAPVQKSQSDQQRAIEALQTFLNNPSDNNHMRLSRLVIAYAATNVGLIKRDYENERSESIRAFSGGRCSPR